MHSNVGELGGDLKTDTVTIIGGALDLQEKARMLPLAHTRALISSAGGEASDDPH